MDTAKLRISWEVRIEDKTNHKSLRNRHLKPVARRGKLEIFRPFQNAIGGFVINDSSFRACSLQNSRRFVLVPLRNEKSVLSYCYLKLFTCVFHSMSTTIRAVFYKLHWTESRVVITIIWIISVAKQWN